MPAIRAVIVYGDALGPDNSLPGVPVYPGQGLPGYQPGVGAPVFPTNPIAPGGLPPQAIQLPVLPFDPTQPIAPGGEKPDNTLPGGGGNPPNNTIPVPPTIWPPRPGMKFLVKWIACVGLVLVPDNSLPGSQPGVDNTLPGGGTSGGESPDNTLPTPEPKRR